MQAALQTSRPPGRPRSTEADEAILDAALALFSERSFENISIDDVAARAGVARATLYRRWTSKASLIAAAIAARRGAPEFDAEIEADNGEELLDALSRLLTSPDFKGVMAHLIGASHEYPELIAAYWQSHVEPRRAAVVALLQAAQAKGRIRADADVGVIVDVLAGAFTYLVLVRPGERTANEVKSHLLAVLRELGLSAGEAGSRTA